MSIGEKILQLRKSKQLSQEQLAEQVGVTRQTISKWELNETIPDLKQSKYLSKIFNISLDELVDNNIQNIIVEKVSNTEKLAGIVIKILKYIGITFLAFVIIDIIALILFITIRKQPSSSKEKLSVLNCNIGSNNYEITIGDDNYFKCLNCDKKMTVYLQDITDWANLEQSTKNINKYFNDNGGQCTE